MGLLAVRTAAYSNGPGQVDGRGIKYPANITAHPFSVTIASAGTVATVWLPVAGRRFRVTGYNFTPSAADTVILRSVASAAFQVTHRAAANTPITVPDLRWGISCASANSALVVDAGTAATVVTGTIFGDEVL
ncbi:MAG: hypothetical protein NUW01_13485 [Gemmatimonadaceae bacterium]|nr:hypothetical protein [Gemmatimonadaceae bacterium]